MTSRIHHRHYEPLYHSRDPKDYSLIQCFSSIISWIPTLLMIGFVWVLGYLFYLLFLAEMGLTS